MVSSSAIGEAMWKRAPKSVHYAVQTMVHAVGDRPGHLPRTCAFDTESIEWAAMHSHSGGAANPGVSFLGGAQGAGVTTLTSHEGDYVTPVRQFISRSPAEPAGRAERTALTIRAATGRIGVGITPEPDQYDLVRLVAKTVLEAADYEAVALCRAVLEAIPKGGGGPAYAGRGPATVDCPPFGQGAEAGGSGNLAAEIEAAAAVLRSGAACGQGLVMYTPLAHMEALQNVRLRPESAAAGIVCVGSRALNRPPDAGGPHGQGRVSVMFDPTAAFKMRNSPHLALETRRGRDGESLRVEAKHMMTVDVDGAAVCLLLHGAGPRAAAGRPAGPAPRRPPPTSRGLQGPTARRRCTSIVIHLGGDLAG